MWLYNDDYLLRLVADIAGSPAVSSESIWPTMMTMPPCFDADDLSGLRSAWTTKLLGFTTW